MATEKGKLGPSWSDIKVTQVDKDRRGFRGHIPPNADLIL